MSLDLFLVQKRPEYSLIDYKVSNQCLLIDCYPSLKEIQEKPACNHHSNQYHSQNVYLVV